MNFFWHDDLVQEFFFDAYGFALFFFFFYRPFSSPPSEVEWLPLWWLPLLAVFFVVKLGYRKLNFADDRKGNEIAGHRVTKIYRVLII